MSCIDYYLKAPSKTAFDAAFEHDDDGNILCDGTLDVIGVIADVDGYHANLRLREGMEVPESLKDFLIDAPQNPVRVFA